MARSSQASTALRVERIAFKADASPPSFDDSDRYALTETLAENCLAARTIVTRTLPWMVVNRLVRIH